ncbi:glycosyltransferase [Winogradskyella sp.]|nr:glycosyltransferase [Winogradskyella sp.]
MKQPLISIIIPVFNAEKYIEDTLYSIFAQTHKDLEVICVDDGSTDNSLNVLSKFSDKITILQQANKGAAAARNKGLRTAKGDFIKFWDADDLMNKKHIEAQYEAIKDHPGHVASCKWGRFYNDDITSTLFKPESVWRNLPSMNWIELALKQKGDMSSSWLWLIPRDVITKSGGWNESLSLNDDFEFSMRLLSKAKGVKFAQDAITYYRSGNSLSLASSNSYQSFQKALKSTELGIAVILQMKSSEPMKTLCANRYQEWVYRMYPDHLDLVKYAQGKVKALGGSTKKMEGGTVFQSLRKIFGWKLAKRIQFIMYKIGYQPKPKKK